MCEYNFNGVCFDPEKHKKGLVAMMCEHCPKQNISEQPDSTKEYINPLFQ